MTGILTAKQAKRQAYIHRVWRLAYLLTTGQVQARKLFSAVLIERPHFIDMDIDILTRLVILRAREYETGLMRSPAMQQALREVQAGDKPETDATTADTLPVPLALICAHALPRQCMEAWLLKRIDGLGDVALSRATDCSRTATTNHLKEAEQQMHEMLGDELEPLVEELKNKMTRLDPAPAVQTWQTKKRRRRLLRLIVISALIIIVLIAAQRVANLL